MPGDAFIADNPSVQSTPSPAQAAMMSPGSDLPPLNVHRPASEYFMGNAPIPSHLREDFSQASPRASPTATSPSLSSSNFGSVPLPRPSMTSHPTGYGPPQPLEPPANNDHRPNSVTGSPHMTSLGWASPSHGSIPSPGSTNDFAYPDPSTAAAAAATTYPTSMPSHVYFPNSTMRRPTSMEPYNSDMKARMCDNTWPTAV